MADTSKLARALAGLPPEQEQQFQTFMAFDPSVRQWRSGFAGRYGEQPNIEPGGNYDYRTAVKHGVVPQPSDTDGGMPHWPSQVEAPPYAAPIPLKAGDHPTMWKQEFMTQFGADPDQLQQFTPEMQAFMQQKIGRF